MSNRSIFIQALMSGAVLATLFEFLKQVLSPYLSPAASHISTVVFFTLCLCILLLWSSRARQRRLHEEKANFEALIDHLPGLACIVETDKRFIRWNQRFLDLLGYSAQELSTKHVPDLIAEDYREQVHQQMGTAWDTGYAEMEATYLTRAGQRIPCYLTGVLIHMQGRPHVLSVGIDLTRRRQAEEQLRKNEESYRRLLSNLPDVTWTANQMAAPRT